MSYQISLTSLKVLLKLFESSFKVSFQSSFKAKYATNAKIEKMHNMHAVQKGQNIPKIQTNRKQIVLYQMTILIMDTHHEEHVRRDPYMNLGAETNFQSQRHTRGKQLQDKVSDPKA